MEKYQTIEECIGYVSSPDQMNTDPRNLVVGSQNVIIDYNRKVRIRNGNSRLGTADIALTPNRAGFTWFTSTGSELPIKMYDDELEVYLGTVDTVVINAYKRIKNGLSTTATPRFTTWWKDSETLDILLYVIGDATMNEWNGAVAVVDSVTANTITKKGTTTFAQNRFYTVANRTLINIRTGTEFAYTGGTGTTTLTGVTGSPVADGMVAGDILVQKVVVASSEPAASRNNHTIFTHENQVCVGSEEDNEVYISQNDDYADFTFGSPRLSGEAGLLTLDGVSRGFGTLSQKLVAFAGKSGIFAVEYEQITVGSTLAETLKVKKLKTGVNQSAQTPESIVPVGNALMYLSFEPAVRMLEQPEDIEGPQLKTLSNPIKPDMDAETWTNAQAIWWKNSYVLTSPVNSKFYILEFIEDADGKLRRFWQPPQVGPVRTLFLKDNWLHTGSNGTPETFKLLDSDNEVLSDLVYNDVTLADEKVPIYAIAKFAYRNFKQPASLKTFDEFFVTGEITSNTNNLLNKLNYDFNGAIQTVENTIDGSDEDILVGDTIQASLGQDSLAQNNLGGALAIPENARRFRVFFEEAREDFSELQAIFESNDLDRYWAITAHGPNVELSRRRDSSIRK